MAGIGDSHNDDGGGIDMTRLHGDEEDSDVWSSSLLHPDRIVVSSRDHGEADEDGSGSQGGRRVGLSRMPTFVTRGGVDIASSLHLGSDAEGGHGSVDRVKMSFDCTIPPRYGSEGVHYGFGARSTSLHSVAPGATGRNGNSKAVASKGVGRGLGYLTLGYKFAETQPTTAPRNLAVPTAVNARVDLTTDAPTFSLESSFREDSSNATFNATLSRTPHPASNHTMFATSYSRPFGNMLAAATVGIYSTTATPTPSLGFTRLSLISDPPQSEADESPESSATMTPPARFACHLDWGAFGRCNKPQTFSLLPSIAFSGESALKTSFPASDSHAATRNRSCRMALRLQPAGNWDVTCLVTRCLSTRLATCSFGLRHVRREGFSWLIRLERGDVSFQIPLAIRSAASTSAVSQLLTGLYLSWVSLVLDVLVAEWFLPRMSRIVVGGEQEPSTSEESRAIVEEERDELLLAQLETARQEALAQARLMSKQAANSRENERKKEGLVILKATYGVFNDPATAPDHEEEEERERDEEKKEDIRPPSPPPTMDATIPLQFWVSDSTLCLPGGISKSGLLGFYNVGQVARIHQKQRAQEREKRKEKEDAVKQATEPKQETYQESITRWIKNLWGSKKEEDHDDVGVRLCVRYQFHGKEYEWTVKDQDAIVLPSAKATLLTPR